MGVARYGLSLALLSACLVMPTAAPANNTVFTFAGTGAAASGGDGGQAAVAQLNAPYDMTWLADGSMVIAEYLGNRVRKISPSGVISTLSTGGGPKDVAYDAARDVIYVAEADAARIRMIDSGGTVTVLGGGVGGYQGDGGPVGGARFNHPCGIDIAPSGDLYVADSLNHRIRRIALDNNGVVSPSSVVTTVAGNGSAGATGDGGPATSATLHTASGLAFDNAGGFAIADYRNNKLRYVNAAGVISTIAGTGTQCWDATGRCGDGGPAASANLYEPFHVTFDPATGAWLFPDIMIRRVRRVSASGVISTIVGSGGSCTAGALCGDGGRAELASTNMPIGVLLGPAGEIYWAGFDNRIRVRVPNPTDTGPTGPAGAQGAQGGAGSQGVGGGQGAPGADGAAGTDGATGAAGRTGSLGAVGSPGADGRDGAAGANGRNGNPGRAGAPGAVFAMRVLLPAGRIEQRRAKHGYVRLLVSGPSTVTVTLRTGSGRTRTHTRTFKRAGRKRFDFRWLGRGSYAIRAVANSTAPQLSGADAVDASSSTLEVW